MPLIIRQALSHNLEMRSLVICGGSVGDEPVRSGRLSAGRHVTPGGLGQAGGRPLGRLGGGFAGERLAVVDTALITNILQ